jgi:hypothetical protein
MSAHADPTVPGRPVQIIAYLKRNPAFTREEFYEHWEKKHAPLAIPLFQKSGVIAYQQVRPGAAM